MRGRHICRPPATDDSPTVGTNVHGYDINVHHHTNRRAGLRPAPTIHPPHHSGTRQRAPTPDRIPRPAF
jgi:hypothetical protein